MIFTTGSSHIYVREIVDTAQYSRSTQIKKDNVLHRSPYKRVDLQGKKFRLITTDRKKGTIKITIRER